MDKNDAKYRDQGKPKKKPRMKILVVDDDAGYLRVLGDLLAEEGHEVLPCSDGKQARECLERQAVDLVISDVYMPTLDGCRFHDYVRELISDESTPFIFVSGVEMDGARTVVVDPQKDFFVSKLAPVQEILALIEHVKDRMKPRVESGACS